MRPKRSKGFQKTASLLRDRIRTAGETRGFAVTKVLTHWAEIVGSDTASICKPVDIKYGRQGFGATLTILTTGAQAPMLEMQKERLRNKVNAAYGYNAIARLRITQTAPVGFAEGQASFAPKPKEKTPQQNAQAIKAAQDIAAPVQNAELRDALETLARNFYAKPKH